MTTYSSSPSVFSRLSGLPRRLLLGSLLATTALGWTLPARGQAITWSGGSNTDFNAASNYTPAPAAVADHDLYFDSTTSASLRMTTNLNLGSLHIGAGADGFRLGRGSNRSLAFKGDGIFVAQNTHATVQADITIHSAQPIYTLAIDVAAGGSLTLSGAIALATGQLVKNGAGALIIESGTGALRKLTGRQGSLHFNEGTVELAAGARIGWGSDMDPGVVLPEMLEITLGTATQSAVFTGSGNLEGQLITHGASFSTIRPDGELTIHTLNAAAGATLAYNLSSSTLIKGAGVFTSASEEGGLAFSFEGGSANIVYTLLDFGSISGMELSDLTIASDGYELDMAFGTGGWLIDPANGTLQVRFAAIPEPNTTACLAAASLALVGASRYAKSRRMENEARRR